MKIYSSIASATLTFVLFPIMAFANHPVFVEGNNGADGAVGTTVTPPGTSGDWDGDGRVGTAEDTDNSTDRIFGTLTAALLGTNGGANANGHVIIVSSGRFNEALRIPNAAAGQANINGVTIIEAAPGVEAVIDAVVAGDGAGNATRQAAPGIVVDTPSTDRIIILRNLVIRNFTVGLEVRNNARVIVENCRFDSNTDAHVHVFDNASLSINDSALRAAGMRFNPAQAAANPGDGVVFHDFSNGAISGSSIVGNTATGVRNAGKGSVRVANSTVFNNGDDFDGKISKK